MIATEELRDRIEGLRATARRLWGDRSEPEALPELHAVLGELRQIEAQQAEATHG